MWLTVQAWVELAYMDIVGLRGFDAIQRAVLRTPRKAVTAPPSTVNAVVAALVAACALYIKQTQCLQRSAAVTRLLRRRGIEADLVIGCHLPPLKAHAWVEVAGDVVSDDLNGLEFYRVLDRW
jgi:hypothetical protein